MLPGCKPEEIREASSIPRNPRLGYLLLRSYANRTQWGDSGKLAYVKVGDAVRDPARRWLTRSCLLSVV
jgi:hypothetical protein